MRKFVARIALYVTLLMICSHLFADHFSSSQTGKVLFLAQQEQYSKALDLYNQYLTSQGKHDFELLHHIGLAIVKSGFRQSDPESQLFALFGAMISVHNEAYPLLEESLKNPHPQIQLIGLKAISEFRNDQADRILFQALGSPHILIRLQAALLLCQKKHPQATAQTESLMYKVPKEMLPIFPPLYAAAGDEKAIRLLRKMLNDSDEKVRLATILSVAKQGRDDFLPQIRQQVFHLNYIQQEAVTYALGVLKDETSIPKLKILLSSQYPNVALAAAQALYRLGHREESLPYIEQAAKSGDVFAIAVLGEIREGLSLLKQLLYSPNLQVRINTTLALLEHSDPDCFLTLNDLLIRHKHDLALTKMHSPGSTIKAWKVVPSASQLLKDDLTAYVTNLELRESILTKARQISEQHFIQLAATILESQQNDLIPITTDLLEEIGSEEAITTLKKFHQKVGAPLVRNYCNLALYRLKEPGPYGKLLKQWVKSQNSETLIQFRPFTPWQFDQSHELTPEETSRLLIQTFEAFAKAQDDQGIEALIEAIQHGNPKNKYALAGLLIRATQ